MGFVVCLYFWASLSDEGVVWLEQQNGTLSLSEHRLLEAAHRALVWFRDLRQDNNLTPQVPCGCPPLGGTMKQYGGCAPPQWETISRACFYSMGL